MLYVIIFSGDIARYSYDSAHSAKVCNIVAVVAFGRYSGAILAL